MKKTTFILGLSLSAILALAGCANNTTNDQAVIDKLSTGLNHVTNAVSAVSVANVDDITCEDFGNAQLTSQTALSKASQTTMVAKNIENNRYQILRKAKNIKKRISGGELKLGNENARAISELTTSMQKYATELARTKSDYNNTVRSIAKLEDANSQFNAKLTRLSCCLGSRDCYLNNILNSLNNVESILNALENSSDNDTSTSEDIQSQNTTNSQKDWGNKTPEDYANQSSSNSEKNYNLQNFSLPQNYNDSTYNYNCPDGNCYPNTYCPNGNCYNYPSNCENGVCYNNASGINGYMFNRGPFNPNRNTDSYGPGVTNIDTYRYTGNGYGANGFNGQGTPHFNGSNGINNITPQDNFEVQPKKETDHETIVTVNAENEKKNADETHSIANPAINAEEKDEKKIVSSTRNAENEVTRPQPKKAETLEIETENKVKSVSADKAKEQQKNDKNLTGEDKAKGHTTITQADINKDIKELLK